MKKFITYSLVLATLAAFTPAYARFFSRPARQSPPLATASAPVQADALIFWSGQTNLTVLDVTNVAAMTAGSNVNNGFYYTFVNPAPNAPTLTTQASNVMTFRTNVGFSMPCTFVVNGTNYDMSTNTGGAMFSVTTNINLSMTFSNSLRGMSMMFAHCYSNYAGNSFTIFDRQLFRRSTIGLGLSPIGENNSINMGNGISGTNNVVVRIEDSGSGTGVTSWITPLNTNTIYIEFIDVQATSISGATDFYMQYRMCSNNPPTYTLIGQRTVTGTDLSTNTTGIFLMAEQGVIGRASGQHDLLNVNEWWGPIAFRFSYTTNRTTPFTNVGGVFR